MIQLITPNFNLPKTFVLNGVVTSYAGWCLKWADDAGGVPESIPPRNTKAKYAYNVEKSAGRISNSIDSPIGIWVVGWLDFTKGPYTVEGHVFWMKHLGGGRYDIRDSEYGSGRRGAYGSINEIVSWFGAYAPKYIGWSTDCDGRRYAKEERNMTRAEAEDMRNIMRVLNSEVKGWDSARVHKGEFDKQEIDYLMGLSDKPSLAIAKYSQQAWDEGQQFRAKRDDAQHQLKDAQNEIIELKKQLANSGKSSDAVTLMPGLYEVK